VKADSQSINSLSSVSQQIVELRSIVKLLSDQVSFLLSYVGVVESHSSTEVKQIVANVDQLPVPTCSDIVQQSVPNLQRSFKEAIVAAVHVDQCCHQWFVNSSIVIWQKCGHLLVVYWAQFACWYCEVQTTWQTSSWKNPACVGGAAIGERGRWSHAKCQVAS